MKKLFVFITSILLMLSVGACTCNNQNSVVSEPVVENMISVDREDMFISYGDNYRWYETHVVLNNYLDEENDGSFESVTNTFQAIVNESVDEQGHYSADTYVVTYKHTDDDVEKDVVKGFWVGDHALNEENIVLTYRDAYERVMECDIVKPHSRNAVLRQPVEFGDCNVQWVFGNTEEQIWVDAVTGEVRDSSPADEPVNE